jgi:Spy/CpxP family protein refolding chaperone
MGATAPQTRGRAAWSLIGIAIVSSVILSWPRTGHSQADQKDHATHAAAAHSPAGDEALADQVKQLKDTVSRLEAALSAGHGGGQVSPMGRGPGMGTGATPKGAAAGSDVRVAAQFQDCTRCHQTRPRGPLPASHLEKSSAASVGAMGQGGGMSAMGNRGMGMMGGGGMRMMDGMMGMMSQGGMAGSQGTGMTDDDEMTGMGAMGKAKGMAMGKMKMSSSLPGFPGASHLYHIGAEGFFLNHDVHITLTADQRSRLAHIKEKALLGSSSCGRKVEEAEQELWELTASDTPDADAVESKVREIEKLRGDQRLQFIRAVGEAAKVLSEEQRQVLVGAAGASHTKH